MLPASYLYPLTYDEVFDIASDLQLDLFLTIIEPCRVLGYVFHDLRAATAFRLTFDTNRWPTINDDVFFMYQAPTAEIAAWVGSCGVECERVEIVAIQFRCERDRQEFEKVLWPNR